MQKLWFDIDEREPNKTESKHLNLNFQFLIFTF